MKKLFVIFGLVILVVATYYFYPEKTLPAETRINKILIRKNDREMDVYSNESLIKTFSISLGGNPYGHKQVQGDQRTPEGRYFVDSKNNRSGYHKNLGISYPNKNEKGEAKRKGIDPGGEIKIHGIRNGFGFIGKFQRWYDWTDGCVALTDQEIDELYKSVEIGTPVEILP